MLIRTTGQMLIRTVIELHLSCYSDIAPGIWYQVLVPANKCPVPGTRDTRCQVPGTSYHASGARYLVPGIQYLVPGTWGARCLVPGARCQVPGAWCLVPGTRHSVPSTW